MFKKNTEREHTCKRCDTVFFSANKKLTPPSRATIAGVKMQATGSSMSVFSGGASKGGYQMQAARLENKRDEALAHNNPACPSCGSGSIRTRIVKK